MRRTLGTAILLGLATLALAGCGDFRERAEATEERLAGAEARASQALDAAAENKAEIRDLRGRVASLEEELGDLLDRMNGDQTAPGKESDPAETE